MSQKIDLIKIDVEGAEFNVLKGAKRILKEYRPIIIIEFGLGASNFYKVNPVEVYKFKKMGLKLYTLKSFLKSESSLTLTEFKDHYRLNDEYYFIASS
tara:strand:- start:288 stop:581 length:294 start_codon:yes stop_codon:yes gene_type:complete